MRSLGLIVALFAILPLQPPIHGRDVEIRASDGASLRATFVPAARRGPAVLLFHQCKMTRTSWAGLGAALAASGLNVLAPDARGSGDNRDVPMDYSKLASDSDAVLAWLLSQPSVDSERVAVGGASCGVDRAVQLARRSGRVKALLLLSGAANPEGMTFVRSGRIPAFFAFSVDEGGPLPEMRDALSVVGHPATRIRELAGAGHGVPMFDADATLLPAIVEWLSRVLN